MEVTEVQTAAPTPQVGESVATPEKEAPQGEVRQQENETQEQQKPESKTPEWAERRFRKLTEQKYQARAEADMARREAEALRQRLSQYEVQPQQARQEANQDPYVLAEQIAEQRLKAQQFDQRANSIVELGSKEFKDDFAGAVKNLQLLGALFDDKGAPTEFSEAVAEYDQPHKILYHLGTNPDEAERILSLPARAQARELARLEARLSQDRPVEPPAVSKAPPPVKPVGAKAVSDGGPSEKDDIATWMKKRSAEVKKR